MLFGFELIAAGALCAALGFHPFTTYPVSLGLLARRRGIGRTPVRRAGATHQATPPAVRAPKIAMCVCAYAEEKVIRAKAENMLLLQDRVPGLQLSIYVDAAPDRTAEILREFADRIHVHVSPERHGKTYGMNLLVGASDADIVVFSDANVMFDPDAVSRLVARFDDPTVGCVCGHLVYVTRHSSATAVTGSLYWRLEEKIKELESQTGSTMGADGSIFAIRRSLHRPPPPDIIDDMFVSLSILCDGYRVVRADDAIAYEETASKSADEFRRKIRISCQAFNVHRLLRHRLATLPPLERYKYVSHKLIRWFSIYFLAAAGLLVGSGLAIMREWLVLDLGVLAALILVLVARLSPSSAAAKVVDILAAFTATGLGIIRSFRGDRFQVWTPPASARGQ